MTRGTGTWYTAALTGASGGSVKRAKNAGAGATLAFTGTGVAFVTTRSSCRGQIEVRLGGVKVATVDLFSSANRLRRVVWARNGLAAGSRTPEIRVLGTQNPSSTSPRVDVDAFLVES